MTNEKLKRKVKHINHNPQVESARAVFGEPKCKGDEFLTRTFK